MDDIGQIVFGDRFGDRMIIDVMDRTYPDANDYWDGNWLNTTVDVVAGPWRGAIRIVLHRCELKALRDRLHDVYDHLDRTVVYDSMEHDFGLTFTGDGKGHITARGIARDVCGRNEISFEYAFDQTYIPKLIEQVSAVEEIFPTIGDASSDIVPAGNRFDRG